MDEKYLRIKRETIEKCITAFIREEQFCVLSWVPAVGDIFASDLAFTNQYPDHCHCHACWKILAYMIWDCWPGLYKGSNPDGRLAPASNEMFWKENLYLLHFRFVLCAFDASAKAPYMAFLNEAHAFAVCPLLPVQRQADSKISLCLQHHPFQDPVLSGHTLLHFEILLFVTEHLQRSRKGLVVAVLGSFIQQNNRFIKLSAWFAWDPAARKYSRAKTDACFALSSSFPLSSFPRNKSMVSSKATVLFWLL